MIFYFVTNVSTKKCPFQIHIGHLYTGYLTDAAARFHKLINNEQTYFSIGTDEHGLKIQKQASEKGMAEQKFCDTNSKKFRDLFCQAGIQFDRFIRTTEKDHKTAVDLMWNQMEKKGFINKGSHSGFYSVNEESFIPEKELVKE